MPFDNISVEDILSGCNCALIDLAGQQTRILNVACPVHSTDPLAQESSTLTPEQRARFDRLFRSRG